MATYLSPAIFTNEIDLSSLPAGSSGIIPGFVGTAKRGEINTPKFVSNAQQFVNNFGEPFPESFLGYAVLAYLEEGNLAWVNRIGIECEEGQPEELSSICIDTSGLKTSGWGRIPVFQGIDAAKINTRTAGINGYVFHDQSTNFISFTDAVINDDTYGPASANLTFVGTDYIGSIDDEFLVLITSAPTSGTMDGAEYSIIRSSDGAEISSGSLVESATPGTSEDIILTDGVVIQIVVTAGVLDINDSFRFSVEPDNRSFAFSVDNADPSAINTYQITGSYATAEDLADAINAISGISAESYTAIAIDGVVQFRAETVGESLQLVGTEAFALEIGQNLWAFDIPRSNLIGIQPGPFVITSSNNIVKFRVESPEGNVDFTATIPVGLNIPVNVVASAINASATVMGNTLVNAYPLTIPGGDQVLVVETTVNYQLSQIRMLANGSNVSTLRFAETVGILFPYTAAFRGYFDSRVALPVGGNITQEIPLSCELFAGGDITQAAQCQVDAAYYNNIVGWFVASTPGTWVDGYKINLRRFESDIAPAGRFVIDIFNPQGVIEQRIDNVSFNPEDGANYVANLLNPGTSGGGVSGNDFVHWIDRPEFLQIDVRNPSIWFNKEFVGQANGIPIDPIFSTELDRAVIGNPAFGTGMYIFSDPEKYNISLLVTPGYSSGAVITTGIAICTQRGDALYIVDCPFGLNAQQVVEWHNGLLFNDLQIALDSSYGALYHPWVKIFDQFNGGNIFTPPSGHVAGVFARTDRVAEQWFAPAGFRRGKLIQALGLEVDNSRGDRDLMYGLGNAVNSIISVPQRGIHIWGQRTLQRRASALDRINVRMLLIAIKKALAGPNGILNDFIFEQNDEITRNLVTSVLESYMGDIQARRGVTGYKVICDDTNNTPQRIDRNELHVAILLKPTRVSEFIVLNLAVLRTDQSFSSEEVLASAGVTS